MDRGTEGGGEEGWGGGGWGGEEGLRRLPEFPINKIRSFRH